MSGEMVGLKPKSKYQVLLVKFKTIQPVKYQILGDPDNDPLVHINTQDACHILEQSCKLYILNLNIFKTNT